MQALQQAGESLGCVVVSSSPGGGGSWLEAPLFTNPFSSLPLSLAPTERSLARPSDGKAPWEAWVECCPFSLCSCRQGGRPRASSQTQPAPCVWRAREGSEAPWGSAGRGRSEKEGPAPPLSLLAAVGLSKPSTAGGHARGTHPIALNALSCPPVLAAIPAEALGFLPAEMGP